MGLLYRCTATVQDSKARGCRAAGDANFMRVKKAGVTHDGLGTGFLCPVHARGQEANTKSGLVFFCRCGEGPLAAEDTFVEAEDARAATRKAERDKKEAATKKANERQLRLMETARSVAA